MAVMKIQQLFQWRFSPFKWNSTNKAIVGHDVSIEPYGMLYVLAVGIYGYRS